MANGNADLSALTLAAQIARLRGDGASLEDTSRVIIGLCRAGGIEEEEAQLRWTEANEIWRVMGAAIRTQTSTTK